MGNGTNHEDIQEGGSMKRVRVTSEQFFKSLKADPRDIMPKIVSGRWQPVIGYRSIWATKDGTQWGESFGEGENKEWYLFTKEEA